MNTEPYTGERRDLKALFHCDDWISSFRALQGNIRDIKPGDFIRFPVKVSDARFGDMKFEALDLVNTEAVVVQVSKDKVIFNFEEVLFYSAINSERTSEGGFSKSVLSAYLNEKFIDALSPVADILAPNKDGQKITLPTQYEVFGKEEYDGSGNAVNWEDEPRQFEYFKNIKNRIRAKDNDTKWWWLSTPHAAFSTYFCYVGSYGIAHGGHASNGAGGVSPAFCIA
ncbi:hypothetical protein AGMMS50268_38230 [Spirochaetia bacterium]|nr:hypothetical protein AGMMS50268_38230 [Spirochaetia bacterium]